MTVVTLAPCAHWSGLAAIAGGVIWVAFHIWYITTGIVDPREVTRIVALPALANIGFAVALWTLFRSRRADSAPKAGILVTLAGMTFFIAGALAASLGVGMAWLVAILGELVITAGLTLFGLANVTEKSLPRWNSLPLLMLALYVPSWMIDPGNMPALPDYWTEWLAALYGLGWILFGAIMWSSGEVERKPPV